MIAERHGGRIELGDAPGGGAAFTLRLPLGGPQDEHPPTPRPDRR
jgi:signal transduction histidine kinase